MENSLTGIKQKKDHLVDGWSKSSGEGDRKNRIHFRDIKETELIELSGSLAMEPNRERRVKVDSQISGVSNWRD